MPLKAAIKKVLWEAFGITMKIYHCLAPRIEVTRSLYGVSYILNTNDHISFLVSPFDWEPRIKEIMTRKWGVVWDVGSNFGLFSILAEKAGNRVVAFDPSHMAISCLNKSGKINGCSNLTTVAKPMAPEKATYGKVDDASCINVMSPVSGGENGTDAITYAEAAVKYGMPDLIKMDIEGGEKDFLENPDFLRWVNENNIVLIVELHNGYFPFSLDNARIKELKPHHILYEPLRKAR